MKNQYHVGELAAYLGISRDTLRLYDKKGILSPHKDPENGYRVYTRADLLCLEYVLRLKQIGLDLDTIKQLVNAGSIDSALDAARQQSRLLRQQLEDLRLLLEMNEDYSRSLSATRQSLGQVSLVRSPRLICRRLEASMTDSLEDFRRLAPGRLPRMAYITPAELVQADAFEQALASCDAPSWEVIHALVLVDGEAKTQIPPAWRDRFEIIEPRACAYASIMTRTGLDYSAYLLPKSFALSQGLTIRGDMISVSATVRNSTQASVDYYQVWLPVE